MVTVHGSSPEGVNLGLLLEYGLLCRDMGRGQDFLSVILAILEVAVYQSKSNFRKARKRGEPRRGRKLWR